jgi:hypothetical protein
MNFAKNITAGLVVSALSMGLFACHEGPAEHVGKEVDKAVEKAGQEIGKVGEKTGQMLENAGEKVRDTAKSATK